MEIKKAGTYGGQVLPKSQLDAMQCRFGALDANSTTLQRRLEFEELKHRLLAFLVVAEVKLKSWTVKYGRQHDVEDMLTDYMNFVHENKLFEQYDKTYMDLKRRAETYKRQAPQSK